MPELPEVETIRKGLEKYLVGHTITNVEIRLAKQISGDPKLIVGGTVTGVRRFGKGLVIDLANRYSMAVHVKMTGQLIYQGPNIPSGSKLHSQKVGTLPGKATHVIFYLDREAVLYYNDTRQFGWIKIVKTSDVSELPFFKSLGPEFLRDMTLEQFKIILKAAKGPIKPLLMDQHKMSGAGNIYANDALFRASIHPRRAANSLTDQEIEIVFTALEEVLKKGIAAGGSSEWSYVNALGEEGTYQKIFLVYGKEGKPCPRCGTPIEKVTIGGRGTFLCPECQV